MREVFVAFIFSGFCTAACSPSPIDVLRKDRPWIPETTRLVQADGKQVLADYVGYPFQDDPDVLGVWTAVDFVSDTGRFRPAAGSVRGDLFVKSQTFLPGGTMGGGMGRWTKGHVLCEGPPPTDFVVRDRRRFGNRLPVLPVEVGRLF